jgi:hypothetical protein
MVIILTESQYNYIKRRYLHILPIFERELKDQVPAFYNNKYGKNEGFERYYDTVKDSVVEFIMYDIPNFYDLDEENEVEITKKLSKEFDLIFFDETKRYYEENRSNTGVMIDLVQKTGVIFALMLYLSYMKIVITESQHKFIRRYQELKDWVRSDYNYLLDQGKSPYDAREITIDHSPMTYLDDPDTQLVWTDKNLNMLRRFIENNFEDLIN